MSTQTAAQDFATGISSDLKLTNIVALATSTAAMIVVLVAFFTTIQGSPANVVDTDTTIALVGGVSGVLIVYLAAQAAVGGAYVSAVTNLSGVNVTAGATAPPVPSTNTATTSISGADLSKITTTFAALTPGQLAALTPQQLGALVVAALA
jgi:hypothetical protein